MFIPLHIKSDYSIGLGTASVEELVAKAVTMGYGALALTDLENLYGQVRFHHHCRLSGVRPLTGVELRVGFHGHGQVGERRGRLVLLASNKDGYRNLCRIISQRRGGAGSISMGAATDFISLAGRHSEGLFALTDDPEVVEMLFAAGKFPPARLGILLVRPDEANADRRRRETAARLGIQLVADLDVAFLSRDDYQLHLLISAIHQGERLEVIRSQKVERGPIDGCDLLMRQRLFLTMSLRRLPWQLRSRILPSRPFHS